MNSQIKISIWVYGVIFAAVAVTGCLAARKHVFHSAELSSSDLFHKEILVSALSYQWHERGVKALPRFSEDLVYRTILIDPGHGGKDPGAQGVAGSIEKNIVLDIGLRLRKILQQRGVKVLMTRADDRFFSLEQRAGMIKEYHPDLFLSLHANSSSDASVSGIEIYYAEEEAYWADVHNALNDVLGGSGEMVSEMPDEFYQYHDWKKELREESAALARHLSSGVTQIVGVRNRGVKHQHFYVLTEAVTPALLVELGFVTNEQEGSKLMTEQYRQNLAEALAKNLLDYVKTQ